MARPITPTSVTREEAGAPIMVGTKASGQVPLHLLPDYNQVKVREACVAAGFLRDGEAFPTREFAWILTESQRPQTPVVPQDSPQDSPQNPVQDAEPQDDQEPQNSPQNSPQDAQEQDGGHTPTIEDLVRKIAGGMDADSAQKLIELMDEKIIAATANLLPVPDPNVQNIPLRDVVKRVELVRPDQPEQVMEGLFHKSFDRLLKNCVAGLHSFLPGEPGTGKSYHAEIVAQMLGWQFASMSCGPTTPESRLWGGMDANGKFFEPPFVRLARFAMENPDLGAIFCLDEMDNGHPGILATTNSAMANGWFTAPNGDVIRWGSNFIVVGCANTFGTGPTAEFSGRNKIDPATLDRFLYVPFGTDEGLETALVHQKIAPVELANAWLDVWRTARKNAADHNLKVFVTMRGALAGARLIATGDSIEDALMLTLGNKVPADQWKKINPL